MIPRLTEAIASPPHSYWLFALAAKHTVEEALRCDRRALRAEDYWQAEWERTRAKRLRLAARSHLEAARDLKRSAAR